VPGVPQALVAQVIAHIRRFKCAGSRCGRSTFSEQIPGLMVCSRPGSVGAGTVVAAGGVRLWGGHVERGVAREEAVRL
jgi:hypothetical protein